MGDAQSPSVGICKICKLSFASFDVSSFLEKRNSSAKYTFMQGAAAHVRGAAEDDAAAGREQHAAAAELQQQQCSAAAAADIQQQLKHASGGELKQLQQHASGAKLKRPDAAGDQDDQAGSSGIVRSSLHGDLESCFE